MSKVLLIIDMQNGFMNKNVYKKLVKRIRNLIDKNDYEKYIFTKFINKNNSMFYRCLNWKNLQTEYSQNICLPVPNNSV